jgi:hypothetical protein
MFFSSKHAGIAAIFLIIMVGLFIYWKIINVWSATALSVGILLAILIEIENRRRVGA